MLATARALNGDSCSPRGRNVDNPPAAPGVAAALPAYPALSPLQLLWWRQMYAHQYYLQ